MSRYMSNERNSSGEVGAQKDDSPVIIVERL